MSVNTVVVREGTKSDCKEIRRMIQELADFENMPEGPRIGHETLEKDGFETNPPLFSCYVAEVTEEGGNKQVVGYAIYYNSYSTWNGRKVNLEDIYVTEKYRHQKIGSRLFEAVAKFHEILHLSHTLAGHVSKQSLHSWMRLPQQKAVQEGCNNLEFSVLAWNSARKFYERYGAINFTKAEEWNMYRLKDEALRKAAQL